MRRNRDDCFGDHPSERRMAQIGWLAVWRVSGTAWSKAALRSMSKPFGSDTIKYSLYFCDRQIEWTGDNTPGHSLSIVVHSDN